MRSNEIEVSTSGKADQNKGGTRERVTACAHTEEVDRRVGERAKLAVDAADLAHNRRENPRWNTRTQCVATSPARARGETGAGTR